MSAIGFTPQVPHAGCGGAPAAATAMPTPGMPAPGLLGGGFAIGSAIAAMPAERFVSSQAGGVILGADGAPAGRIPAGSFVDTRNGSIFGPDGKPFSMPEGSTADFFDLPDIAQLMRDASQDSAARQAAGGGATSTATLASQVDHLKQHVQVDGQWGPGGITPIKGGAAGGCDAEHGAPDKTSVGGASGPGAGAPDKTSVAGASGGGPTAGATAVASTGNPMLDGLNRTISDLMAQVRRLTPGGTSASGGGSATLAASNGAASLGSTDLLRLAVRDLVGAIGQLNLAIRETGILGGGPGQQPPTKAPDAPPKTDAPPVVEPPKTETPSTDSGSSSGSDTSAPPASGSSSS